MAGTATGFQVAPAELTSAGQEFNAQAQQLTTVHGQITSASVPATAFGGLPQSSQAAQKHTATMNSLGQTVNTAQQRTGTLATGLTTSAQNYNTGDEQTAAAYRSLLNGTNGASSIKIRPACCNSATRFFGSPVFCSSSMSLSNSGFLY